MIRYERIKDKHLESKNVIYDNYFLSSRYKPLTDCSIDRVIKQAGKVANVRQDIRVSAHTCRHWYAQTQLKNGLDVYSLFSSKLLEHLFGCKINYFVDFNEQYIDEEHNKVQCQVAYRANKTEGEIICVDFVSESQCAAWDNHVTMLSEVDIPYKNENSANINNIYNITNKNFYEKACLSTLIQIMSYYNIQISNMNDEQKLVLTFIDSVYRPFKVIKKDFRPIARKWLHLLEYDELAEFIEYRVVKNGFRDFEYVNEKYKLDSKIVVGKNGKLKTDIKLDELSDLFGLNLVLPEVEFCEFKRYDKIFRNLNRNPIKEDEGLFNDNEKLFNFAVTNKDVIVYSKSKIS